MSSWGERYQLKILRAALEKIARGGIYIDQAIETAREALRVTDR